MELNITNFFNNAAPMDYSASIAEIGHGAGMATWQAAVDDSPDYPLLSSDSEREEVREYFKSFGAWEADEIAAWSDIELNALLIQFISGDIRESNLDSDSTADDWEAYEADCREGTASGRIYKGDDGQVYFYIGE